MKKKHPLADLQADLHDHIESETQENIERGMTPEEAGYAALRKFGNVMRAHEDTRAVWIPIWLDQLGQDVRYALRSIRRAPSFAIVAVVTLAVAIGFNTTLFTIVSGMAPTPPVDDPERMVAMGSLDPEGRAIGVSYLDFQDWRHATMTFQGLAAYGTAAMILTDRGLAAERVAGAYISAETFSLIRERPILGRDFRPADERPAADPVVIIAASLWKGRYGSDPGLIGREITVNGMPATVVGVMREGFRFPLVHDLWQPLASLPESGTQARDVRRLSAFGRLANDVHLEQARAELSTIASALSKTYPKTNASVRPRVEPFAGRFTLANPWNAMLAAVTIVLLVACANVANLLLARAAYRSNEIAIRTSLGATRWRIMRQLLVESGLLAAVAGTAGVGVALLGVRLWLASMPGANWPYWFHFAVNGRVLAYLTVISAGSALLFGLGPALHISKWYPGARVKQSGRGSTTGPPTQRWTSVLLVAEFALTLSLLAGAGLLARTLIVIYRADSIVDTSNVILAGLDLPPQKYATPAERIALYSQLEARVGALPSVDGAALASGAPFYNAPVWSVKLQGQPPNPGLGVPTASYVLVGSRYFDTLRLRLIRGRVFEDRDGTPGHLVALVNQEFASRHFPGVDPIGRRIQLTEPDEPDPSAPWLTIVGVSPTVRQQYAQEIDPVVYLPYRFNPIAGMVLMARARSDATALTPALREHLRQLDPDLPLVDIRPLDWLLSGTRFANQVFATLFGIAAALALLLAAVGLHAITGYAIHQRTQEIGIRMVLGARPSQVVWLFLRRVLATLACGLAMGLGGAFAVGQFVRSMLIQTSPGDPLTLAAISVVLIGVALTAALRPARRATHLDPVSALRSE